MHELDTNLIRLLDETRRRLKHNFSNCTVDSCVQLPPKIDRFVDDLATKLLGNGTDVTTFISNNSAIFRTKRCFSWRRDGTPSLEYDRPELIEARLRTLILSQSETVENHLAKALFTNIALIGIHPFSDYNGRAARQLTNTILQMNGLFTSPLLLEKMVYAARGEYLRVQERVLLRNEWSDYLRFFLMVFNAMIDIKNEN